MIRRAPTSRAVVALALASAVFPLPACSERAPRTRLEESFAARHVPATPTVVATEEIPMADASAGASSTPDSGAALASTRFVIIGDYGQSGPNEANVAALVARLKPDFVITTGDNNYPLGEAETIDENIGRYFHEFIAPYRGKFGAGAKENRFFPSLGNHDWYAPGAQPFFDYFSLPNNERYHQLVRGDVQLFALDSDFAEPDGNTADSKQAEWLREQLAAAVSPWRVVFFHHPPYSSGAVHGSTTAMRWPFAEWGASIVYAGHDHTYERLSADGFPYIVNGVGGNGDLYELLEPLPESLVRHAKVQGLVLVTATANDFVSRFLDARGEELDVFSMHRE